MAMPTSVGLFPSCPWQNAQSPLKVIPPESRLEGPPEGSVTGYSRALRETNQCFPIVAMRASSRVGSGLALKLNSVAKRVAPATTRRTNMEIAIFISEYAISQYFAAQTVENAFQMPIT